MRGHVDISLTRRIVSDAPTRRLPHKTERDILVAITDALNMGYDGVRIIWDKNKPEVAHVNYIKQSRSVRCG